MRLILTISLMFLAACSPSKPAVDSIQSEDPRCKEMSEVREWAKSQGLDEEKTLCDKLGDKCLCTETIICEGKPVCYSIYHILE